MAYDETSDPFDPYALPLVRVDDQAGSDSQRFALACTAALKKIPSTVLLPPSRELALTSPTPKVRPGVNVMGDPQGNSRVYCDFPGAAAPSGSAPAGMMVLGGPTVTTSGSMLGGFQIRGRATGFYRLLVAQACREPWLRDLDFGVCGQSFVELRDVAVGSNLPVVDRVVGRYGGDNSFDRGSSKYKLHMVNTPDAWLRKLDLGRPFDVSAPGDRYNNQSFVTFNASPRGIVSDSNLWYTQTYCANTHGSGSNGTIFRRVQVSPGVDALYGAFLVGNEAWGPDVDVVVRDCLMVGPGKFSQVRAGSTLWLVDNVLPSGAIATPYTFGPGSGIVHVTTGDVYDAWWQGLTT